MHEGRRGFQMSLLGVLGIAVVGSTIAVAQRRGDDYKFFDELIEVRQAIAQRYVDAPSDKQLREGAIKGMIEALNDPYTVYVPASERRDFNKELTGEYVGIGAYVNGRDGWLTIVSPLEDSPAFRAALLADDRVVEIDGTTTQNLSIDQCIDLLMGEPGTNVRLVIERKGDRFPVEIKRERIKTRAVKGFSREARQPDAWRFVMDEVRGIAYVRLTQFTPLCASEVEQALRSVGADKGRLKGLVLDLRFNPGGLLSEAESLADLFLEEGVIVSTRGRSVAEKVTRAEKGGTLPNFPIALLINEQSASASEVLAGALIENNRAIAIGTRTFGKGSVQVVLELPSGEGSELKITEQGYYLPSGRSITRKDDSATWGVDPTAGFFVPMNDEQVAAMLSVRRKEEIINAGGTKAAQGEPAAVATTGEERWSDPSWVGERLKDPQLASALQALQARVDTGAWPAGGNAEQTAAAIDRNELKTAREWRDRLMKELARTEKRVAAIESGSAGAKAAARDLWADGADVVGGVVEVRDSDGKVIATLRVTGSDLERWLADADVEPIKPEPDKTDAPAGKP